jgi:hypothetical protein
MRASCTVTAGMFSFGVRWRMRLLCLGAMLVDAGAMTTTTTMMKKQRGECQTRWAANGVNQFQRINFQLSDRFSGLRQNGSVQLSSFMMNVAFVRSIFVDFLNHYQVHNRMMKGLR